MADKQLFDELKALTEKQKANVFALLDEPQDGQPVFEAAASYLLYIAVNHQRAEAIKQMAAKATLEFLQKNGHKPKYDERLPYDLCNAMAQNLRTKKDVAGDLKTGPNSLN